MGMDDSIFFKKLKFLFAGIFGLFLLMIFLARMMAY